jgi:hypothetical protein
LQLESGIFQRLAHAALFMLTGIVLLLFVVLFGSRTHINEELRVAIQKDTLDNVGLALEVGAVRGTWWSGLTLQDVRVHAGPELDSPLLGKIPLVQVEYSLLSFLGSRPRPVRVDAYQPNVALSIGVNRIFNLRPKPKAPHDEKVGDPPPPVDMIFHGGHISYEDLSVRKPFKVEVANLTGTGTLRGVLLALDLQALRSDERINAQVNYDLLAQKGEVQAHVRGLSLPYWVNRFGYNPSYEMTGGRGDLEALASWHDPMMLEELKVTGTAHIYGGEAKLKNVAKPLINLHGDISFNQSVANLPHMTGTIEGMPVVAHGRVNQLLTPVPALGGPDQELDLVVETPHVELEKLDRLFPGLKSLKLAGLGNITAQVSGTSSSPHVVMRGLVPAGRYGKEPVTHVLIDADYVPGRFDLPRFALDLAQGHAEGKAFVGIPEVDGTPVPYTVDTRFSGVELAEWVTRYRQEPFPFAVSGRLHGELHTKGVGAKVETNATLAVASGLMNHEPVQACTATYHYATPQWTVPAWSLRWGATSIDGSARGADAAPFRVAFQVASGSLAQWVHLNPHPPKTRLEGGAKGAGEFGGDAADPNTWTGAARLQVSKGILDKQTFEDADAAMTLAHNSIAVESARAHTVGGLVRARGTYTPFILKRDEYPTTDLEVAASGMALGQMATLPTSMKTAKGAMDGRFTVHIHNQDVILAGRMRVMRPRLPGWARFDQALADFTWTPVVSTLRPLIVQEGADKYEITGTIGQLDETYPLDLRIRAARADVKTSLGVVQWPDVMAKLMPQRLHEPASLGPLRDVGALPPAPTALHEGPPFVTRKLPQAGTFALTDALEHWQAVHKAPLHRTPPEAPLLPFWQESSGKMWVDAHLTGPVLHPDVKVAASVKHLEVFKRLIDDGSLVLTYDHDRLSIPRFRLIEGGRTVVTAGGALGNSPADSLVVRTFGLDLDWSRRALASKQLRLEGRGDMALRLSGPWSSPRAYAIANLKAGRFTGPGLEPIAFDAIDANLAYERGRLAIQHASVQQSGKLASFTGSLPVETAGPNAPIELSVRLEDDNLAILNLFGQRHFQWLGGKGLVEIRMGGTMGQPSLAGKVTLAHGSFKAEGLDEAVQDFSADVTLNDQRIDIKSLRGLYGGGDLELAGTVLWNQFQPQKLFLTAKAKPFRLKLPNDNYQGMVEADLKLTGPFSQPTLGGLVSLWDGAIDLRDEKAPAKSGQENRGPALPPLRLANLNIQLGPGLRIKNSLIDIDVTTQRRQGHLVVDGSLAAPQPRGVVIIEGGTIRPLNNPFKIVEGKVEFLGERLGSEDDLLDILGPNTAHSSSAAALNARLDVQARTTVYDYSQNENVNVLARVTGSLGQMDMRFSSEPLRSEQEILDILSKKQVLAGTFGGKLDRGEVIVKEVGGFVSSNIEELISPYTLFLRNALNLQTFRLDLVSDYTKAGLSDLAGFRPALTLETRPLWERLSFNTRMVVGEIYTTSPTLNGENTYVSLNFRLTRWLGVEYRIDPYVDPANDRVLGQRLGLRTQITF